MAAPPVAMPVVKLASPSWLKGEPLHLKLAPGTTSGFKGVHKAGNKWEARLWVAGKGTRVLWRDESAEECAAILAMFERYPCEIPTPKKGRAKPGEGQVCCALSTASSRVDGCLARLLQPAVLRKRQKRAEARAAKRVATVGTVRDRIPLSPVKST